jgi:hypothetical protein
MVAKNG